MIETFLFVRLGEGEQLEQKSVVEYCVFAVFIQNICP